MQYAHKVRKEREKMKITIEAESKEITDFVISLQSWRVAKKTVDLFPKNFNSTLAEAIRRASKHNETEET